MHFTVTLRGDNTFDEDHSYGLVFNPNPIWVKGNRKIFTIEQPKYKEGSVRKLLQKEGLVDAFARPRSATVVVHHLGLGSSKDLATLIGDLEAEGFQTVSFE